LVLLLLLMMMMRLTWLLLVVVVLLPARLLIQLHCAVVCVHACYARAPRASRCCVIITPIDPVTQIIQVHVIIRCCCCGVSCKLA
jgi:hypothetical protein